MIRKLIGILTLFVMSLFFAATAFADASIINVYDANGNLVSGDGKYYEYNDANQLVRVRQGSDQTGTVIAEYFYDYAGQRIKKIENGIATYYVGQHYKQQVGAGTTTTTNHYFADGERVARKDTNGSTQSCNYATGQGECLYYYHLNHLDSTTAITDSAGNLYGSITTYTPFGEIKETSGTDKYSFTGKEKDNTDLYYFDARYNDPEFRHFTQADIADPDYSDPQDLNRYSYVGNNPLNYIDTDGYKKKKKKHLSKREQRARALGLNPDKEKYWVGKLSHKQFKKLEKQHNEYEAALQAREVIARCSISTTTTSTKYPLALDSSLVSENGSTSASKQNRLKNAMMYASAMKNAARYEQDAAWDEAEVNILEGTYGGLKTLGEALSGDEVGAAAGLIGMFGTLAKAAGNDKLSTGLDAVSSGIDAVNLADVPDDFSDVMEHGTEAGLKAAANFVTTGSTIFDTGLTFLGGH